jgi:hypothetical protein
MLHMITQTGRTRAGSNRLTVNPDISGKPGAQTWNGKPYAMEYFVVGRIDIDKLFIILYSELYCLYAILYY